MLLERPRFELTTSRGEYILFMPAPSVAVPIVRGYCDEQIAQAMIDQTKILLRVEKSIAVFADASEMKSYSTGARVMLTAFTKDVLPRFRTIHFYVRSKIVSMGISVVNVALDGRIEAHQARARFDAAIQFEIDRVLGSKRLR
jgi:hypothetical protein